MTFNLPVNNIKDNIDLIFKWSKNFRFFTFEFSYAVELKGARTDLKSFFIDRQLPDATKFQRIQLIKSMRFPVLFMNATDYPIV